MKKIMKKIKIFALPVLFVLAIALACSLFITNSDRVFAEEWSTISIENEYKFGQEFTVPEMTVTVNDGSVVATPILTFPDGTVTAKKRLNLDKVGAYALTYNAVIGGKAYSKAYDFTVKSPLFSVGANSTASYGIYQPSDPEVAKGMSRAGLMVSLYQGEKFTYNRLISVEGITKEDKLFEIYATPETTGILEFSDRKSVV